MSGPPKSSVFAKTSCCIREVCTGPWPGCKRCFVSSRRQKRQQGILVGCRRHMQGAEADRIECRSGGRADAESLDRPGREMRGQVAENPRTAGRIEQCAFYFALL